MSNMFYNILPIMTILGNWLIESALPFALNYPKHV